MGLQSSACGLTFALAVCMVASSVGSLHLLSVVSRDIVAKALSPMHPSSSGSCSWSSCTRSRDRHGGRNTKGPTLGCSIINLFLIAGLLAIDAILEIFLAYGVQAPPGFDCGVAVESVCAGLQRTGDSCPGRTPSRLLLGARRRQSSRRWCSPRRARSWMARHRCHRCSTSLGSRTLGSCRWPTVKRRPLPTHGRRSHTFAGMVVVLGPRTRAHGVCAAVGDDVSAAKS